MPGLSGNIPYMPIGTELSGIPYNPIEGAPSAFQVPGLGGLPDPAMGLSRGGGRRFHRSPEPGTEGLQVDLLGLGGQGYSYQPGSFGDVNLNEIFGTPTNPHGLEPSSWGDIGQLLPALLGGIPGLVGYGANEAVDQQTGGGLWGQILGGVLGGIPGLGGG